MNGIKKAFLIFGLLLIYPILAIAHSDTNLVANPDFESGTTVPLNWTFVSINENTPIWSGSSHNGSKSIEISRENTAPKPVPSPAPTPNVTVGATIAYMGDAEPGEFGKSGITELTKDFNQIIPQSPTGKVDAIILLGDMSKISQVRKAYSISTAKNIPIFHVIGNHEVENSEDMADVRSAYSSSLVPLNPGPVGTDKTTYSFNIGNFHIVNINLYWDGRNNDAWFKYGDGGGYVPDTLYNWVKTDLAKTSKPWKIVVGHEPLYPLGYHVGNSLDQDVSNRDKLESLFISQKVAVYLSGHTHTSAVQLKP